MNIIHNTYIIYVYNIYIARIWTNNSEGIVIILLTSQYPKTLHINPPQIMEDEKEIWLWKLETN